MAVFKDDGASDLMSATCARKDGASFDVAYVVDAAVLRLDADSAAVASDHLALGLAGDKNCHTNAAVGLLHQPQLSAPFFKQLNPRKTKCHS